MTPERWAKVKSVFQASLEQPAEARAMWVADICAGDSELRVEVESLLASHAQAGKFLERPALAAAESPAPGERLGVYRVVQKIGEGGMSTVFQAVRDDDQFRKLVAIKVLKRGMDTDYLLRRFHNEREILAHFDHPNIAKILDGGSTPDGRPYFVMEFIAGDSIDTYCDEHRLSVQTRLELFVKVCAAVEYAHQNLVVHRDLKPRNILVAEGEPKLLDFGIAKLLADERDETAAFMRVMTPDYASPEQVRGEPITTASDVYSLGVVLFELLTGQRPYILRGRSLEETATVITHTDPGKPSTAVGRAGEKVATLRDTRIEKLRRQLAGDLDNILGMALRKEPAKRYPTVEQFSADIRRHLDGRPVMARKDTLGYRTQKFVTRHRMGVAATAAVILALTSGLIASLWSAHVARQQRVLAEHRFNLVRKLANSILFEVHDAIESLPGSTQARELLLRRAQEYMDSLAEGAGNSGLLQRERAEAYMRIGDVLGDPSRSNLGNVGLALENYHKSLRLNSALAAAEPGNASYLGSTATNHERICTIEERLGRFKDALESCTQAVKLREAISSAVPADRLARGNLGFAYQSLASPYFALGDWDHARKYRAKALAVFEELVKADPGDEVWNYNLGIAYLRIAGLEEQTKNFESARDFAKKAASTLEKRAAAYPHDVRAQLEPTFALQRLGSVLISLGDLKGALEAFQKVLPIREQLVTMDPWDARAVLNLARSHDSIAFVMMRMGNPEGALEHIRKEIQLSERLVAKDPQPVEHHTSLALASENLGSVSKYYAQRARSAAERARHWREARPHFLRALKIFDDLKAKESVPADLAAIHERLKKEIVECDSGLGQRKTGT